MIQNVVAKKLLEGSGTPIKHGYIISGKDSADPTLQLIGYGNMPASMWKNKIVKGIKDALDRAERDEWKSVAYLLQDGGVLSSAISMMEEVYDKSDVSEAIGSTDSASASNPPITNSSPDVRNQQELDKYQKKLSDLTNQSKEIDANIARLEEPVKKQVARLEQQKSEISKKQGPIVQKIDQLKAKSTPQKDTQQP